MHLEVSGTLYDLDTAFNDGLGGETILIYIDGVQVASAITSLNGEYSASIRAESSYERGVHLMALSFEGSPGHLPVSSDKTVVVWAEVEVDIDKEIAKKLWNTTSLNHDSRVKRSNYEN